MPTFDPKSVVIPSYVCDRFPRFDEVDAYGVPFEWVIGKVDPTYMDGDTITIIPDAYKFNSSHNHSHYNASTGRDEIKIRLVGIDTFEVPEHTEQKDKEHQAKILAKHWLPETDNYIQIAYEVGDEARKCMQSIMWSHDYYAFAIIDTFDSWPNGASAPGHDVYNRHVGQVFVFVHDEAIDRESNKLEDTERALNLSRQDINYGFYSLCVEDVYFTNSDVKMTSVDDVGGGLFMPMRVGFEQEGRKSIGNTFTYLQVAEATKQWIKDNRVDMSTIHIGSPGDGVNYPQFIDTMFYVSGLSSMMNKSNMDWLLDFTADNNIALSQAIFTFLDNLFSTGGTFNPKTQMLAIDSSAVLANDDGATLVSKLTFSIETIPGTADVIDTEVKPYTYWKRAAQRYLVTKETDVPLDFRLAIQCVNLTMLNTWSKKHKDLQLAHSNWMFARDISSVYPRLSPTDYGKVASSFHVVAWSALEKDIVRKDNRDTYKDTYTESFDKMYELFRNNNRIYMDKHGNLYKDTGENPANNDAEGLKTRLVKLDKDGKETGEDYNSPDYISSNLNPVPALGSDYGVDIVDTINPLAAAPKIPRSEYSLLLGDVEFMVPPLAINIQESAKNEKVQTMRTKSSMQIQSGYSDCRITLQLFFSDIESINGFPVKNPFKRASENLSNNQKGIPDNLNKQCNMWAEPYSENGLRTLLAQFRKTPFLPVCNELLESYGIFNVALESITVSTVPNFPNTLAATLTLIPFNVIPYSPDSLDLYTKINWPIFRWFIQSSMQKRADKSRTYLKPIENKMDHKIKFKIADETELQSQIDAMLKLRKMYSTPVFKDNNTEDSSIDKDLSALQSCRDQKRRYQEYVASITDTDEQAILRFCKGNTEIWKDLYSNEGTGTIANSEMNGLIETKDLTWFLDKHNKIVGDVTRIRKMRIMIQKKEAEWNNFLASIFPYPPVQAFAAVFTFLESINANDAAYADVSFDPDTDPVRDKKFKRAILIDICDGLINNMSLATYMGQEPAFIYNYFSSKSYNLLDDMATHIVMGLLAVSNPGLLALGLTFDWALMQTSKESETMRAKLKEALNKGQDGVYAISFRSKLLNQELPQLEESGGIAYNGSAAAQDIANVWNTIKAMFGEAVKPNGNRRAIIPDELIDKFMTMLKNSAGAAQAYEETYYDMLSRAKVNEEELTMVDFVERDQNGNPVDPFKDLIITGITCSMNNVYSEIQLEDQDRPTLQFFGSQDATYTIAAQTTNRETLMNLQKLFSESQRLSRSYRIAITSGFLEIENDIVNLCGTRAVLPESIDYSTVPNFPELINIKISFSAFDVTQKRRETPMQMQLHQDGKFSFKEDWINYIQQRSKNEESQMMAFEQKLRQQEVYPDLELPTHYEFAAALPYLNCGIDSMADFDKLFATLGPNRGKFVDPDFYVNCDYTPRMQVYENTYLADARQKQNEAIRLLSTFGEKRVERPPVDKKFVDKSNSVFTDLQGKMDAGAALIADAAKEVEDNDKTVGGGGGGSPTSGTATTGGGVTLSNNSDATLTGTIPVINTSVVKSYGNMGDDKNKQCSIEYTYKIPSKDQLLEWYYSGATQAQKNDAIAKYDAGKFKELFKNPSKNEIYAEVLKNVKEMIKPKDGAAAASDTPYLTKIKFDGTEYELITPTTISYEKIARMICSTFLVESGYAQFEYDKNIYVQGKGILVSKVDVAPHYARTQVRHSNAIGLGQLTSGSGSIESPESFYRASWDWKWNVKLSCNRWAWCYKYALSDAYNVEIKDASGNKLDLRLFILEMACQYYKMKIKPAEFLPQKRWRSAIADYKKLCSILSVSTETKDATQSEGSGGGGAPETEAQDNDTSTVTQYGFDTIEQANLCAQNSIVTPMIMSIMTLETPHNHHDTDTIDKNVVSENLPANAITGVASDNTHDHDIISILCVPTSLATTHGSDVSYEEKYTFGATLTCPTTSKDPKLTFLGVPAVEDHDKLLQKIAKNQNKYAYGIYTENSVNFIGSLEYNSVFSDNKIFNDNIVRMNKENEICSAINILGIRELTAHPAWQVLSATPDNYRRVIQRIAEMAWKAALQIFKKYPTIKPHELVLSLDSSKVALGMVIGDILQEGVLKISQEPMTREELMLKVYGIVGDQASGSQRTEQEELMDSSNTALTDYLSHSQHGRLLRAFPTFQMFIIDEGEWKLFYKMWDNLYGFNAIESIDVVRDKRIAADTALITMTNLYSNLTTKDNLGRAGDWEFSIINALFKGDWTRMWTVITNNVDEAIFESRKEILDSLLLRPGARLHLRMGYGSNAEALPIVFNGTITEISPPGERITVVAQSDGLELTNRIPANKNDTNDTGVLSWFELPHDPVQTLLEIMTSSGNFFKDVIAKLFEGFGVRGNPLGIEHFGAPNNVPADLLRLPSFRYSSHKEQYGELGINIHDLSGKRITSGWVLSTVPSDFIKDEKMATAVDGYNIIAYLDNINSTYDSQQRPKIYLYDKTVWDVANLLATCLPDFITGVVPFGLRSTLFFGKPYFALAYDYDYLYCLDPALKKITAKPTNIYRKSYEQYHLITSIQDIVSNKIVATSEGMQTNVIVTYGGQAGAKNTESPLISMDTDIRAEYQKTAEHYLDLAPSSITEGVGDFFCSKNIACVAGANILKEYAGGMYDGELLVLGIPSLKPHDSFGLKDTYNDMSGIAGVRRVVQHMSLETGFTTSITPHCLSVNDDNYMIPWRLWMASVMGHAIGDNLMRWIPALMFSNWRKTLLNRALLYNRGSAIKHAEKHVLTRIVDSIFGYGDTSIELRKLINKHLTAQPGVLLKNFSQNAPLTALLNDIKKIDTSKLESFSSIDTKKFKVFSKFVETVAETYDPKTNTSALLGFFKTIDTDEMIAKVKNADTVADFVSKLDDIENALKIVEDNRAAFSVENGFTVADDIADVRKDVAWLKELIAAAKTGGSAEGVATSAELVVEMERVGKRIPTALKVANGIDDTADIAKAIRGIKSTARLISFAKGSKALASVAKVMACLGGPVGIAVEIAIEITVEILTRMLVEAYRRYLKNRQAITIVPLRYRGRTLTAGIGGHRGAVIGDSPSTIDRFFYDKNGATILGTNIGVDWLNDLLFDDKDFRNPMEKPAYDPYDWLEQIPGMDVPYDYDVVDNDTEGDS